MNVATDTRETLTPDVQGSIVGVLNSGTGALTRIGYEAFGENPGLTSGTYRYTAQRLDPETAGSTSQPSGLYDYRARIYSPTLGRFLQPDPAGYTAGDNLYAYVGNDPVDGTDPSGKCIEDLCIVEGAAVIEAVETAPIWAPAAIAGVKAVAGFALGYGGAALSGVQSTEGRVLAGAVGAVGLPAGSYATSAVAGLVGSGTTAASVASVATGGAFAYGTGFGAEYAGQQGDINTGYQSELNVAEMNKAGLATTAAYGLLGEAALTAVAAGSEIGTTAEIVGSANTAAGSLLGQKLLDIGNGYGSGGGTPLSGVTPLK